MAVSTRAIQKFRSKYSIKNKMFTASGTSAAVASGISFDMSKFQSVYGQAFLTDASDTLTKFEVVASAASDLSSPVAIKELTSLAADAAGDWVCLEVQAKEVRSVDEQQDGGLTGLRYIGFRLTCGASGDNVMITGIGEANEESDSLTATLNIA